MMNITEGQLRARLIAMYLPQFYPNPENDRWWGPGFSEWTNVAQSRPVFRGHVQPQIPGELGFYDLRLAETRADQAELARAHGIEGFCYWHYWFLGKRHLERPFAEVLASGEPDFPFCLAWANDHWQRTWIGQGEMLQKQEYSPEDDVRHARWLVEVLADPRNIRVNGRPLFLIYKPSDLPEPHRTTDTFREECTRAGLPNPYLLGFNSYSSDRDCRPMGFDGTVDFEPQFSAIRQSTKRGARFRLGRLRRNIGLGVANATIDIFDYSQARAEMAKAQADRDWPRYPCVLVGWDNTPRRGRNAIVMLNSTPEALELGLAEAVDASESKPFDDRLVFLNAWNEWAEGNFLEPDRLLGRARLETVRRVVSAPTGSVPGALAGARTDC